MDQQSVESLLRRLVERVEESERRYGEALEELHARLDQLSQTTDAARVAGAPEDAETLDRLHSQVSHLARRLEQEATTPLDDFERIGQALSGGLDYAPEPGHYFFGAKTEPSGFVPSPDPSAEPAGSSEPGFSYPPHESAYSPPPVEPSSHQESDRDLDSRLVEMAHRLEHSIGTAMPVTAIEALNARLEEIGSELAQALEKTPKLENLEHVERQLSEMGQQLGRAELQLAKMGSIESQLLQLIERFDQTPSQVEAAAAKAAEEVARRVVGEAKPDSTGRLDAMQRDITALGDKNRASNERVASTLAAVHEQLKQLVQQVEQGSSALPAKPNLPFAERQRPPSAPPMPPQGLSQPPLAPRSGPAETSFKAPPAGGMPVPRTGTAPSGAAPQAPLAGSPDAEPVPSFGRLRRGPAPEEAVDLGLSPPRATRATLRPDADIEPPDNLVAAARRAAQAASLKAEERASSGRGHRGYATSLAGSAAGEPAPRKRRSILIVLAAVLLIISALLLYGRLGSKPEPVVEPPAAEQTLPAPTDSAPESSAPGLDRGVPAPEGSDDATPPDEERSGSWEPTPQFDEEPAAGAASEVGKATGFTEIAKSSRRATMPSSELTAEPQPAALKPDKAASLPPGVVFSVEEPAEGPKLNMAALETQPTASPALPAAPAALPLPPAELGPVALRQAAADGDPAAQYVIALRYVENQGNAKDQAEAVRWLERAASAGLAPAQYRLGAMYERGQGVAKDLGRSRSWYQSTAEKGNVKAMHNLAVGASAREGGAPDYALAAKWYQGPPRGGSPTASSISASSPSTGLAGPRISPRPIDGSRSPPRMATRRPRSAPVC
jgi:localization factor PodJL